MLYITALLLLFGTYVYLALNNCQMYQALNNCKNISTNIPLRAMKTLSGTLSRTMSSSLLINETPPYQLYSWDCKPPGNGVNAIFSVLYRINSIQRHYNLFLIAFCHCHSHPDERARQRSVFTANLWGWYRRLLWFAPLRRPESSQWSCHWVRPRRLSRSSCAGAQRWGRVPRWQQGKWMDPRAAGEKKIMKGKLE